MSVPGDVPPFDVSGLLLPRTPKQRQQANEPTEEIRRIAATWWNFFCALTREGFTEHQALILIGVMANPNLNGDTPK